jgi:hypothetical protein
VDPLQLVGKISEGGNNSETVVFLLSHQLFEKNPEFRDSSSA